MIFFEVPATRAAAPAPSVCTATSTSSPSSTAGANDLGPWTPKYENGLLYGRGGADDGYAIYAITAIEGARPAQGIARRACVGLIETCEESGSFDLPAYLDLLRPRLGGWRWSCAWTAVPATTTSSGSPPACAATSPARSGGDPHRRHPLGDAERAWCLRASASCAGCSTGWRTKTGELLPARSTARCRPTVSRRRATAEILGDEVWKRFPWALPALMARPRFAHHHRPDAGAHQPHLEAHAQRHRRRRFSEPCGNAGNVLRPYTAFSLPRCRRWWTATAPPANESPARRQRALQRQGDLPRRWPPAAQGASGWNAPTLAPWMEQALHAASSTHFGAPCGFIGQGGTIPLMGMLQQGFPRRR